MQNNHKKKGIFMKKFGVLPILFALSACGTLGIGSNHETRLYNNSKNTITVSADSGVYKIKPDQDMVIFSNNDFTLLLNSKIIVLSGTPIGIALIILEFTAVAIEDVLPNLL